MTDLAENTRKFWSAAYFYRRAPKPRSNLAVSILRHVAETTTGKVQSRAETLLREISDGADKHASRKN